MLADDLPHSGCFYFGVLRSSVLGSCVGVTIELCIERRRAATLTGQWSLQRP
jgi:hypothetical protein